MTTSHHYARVREFMFRARQGVPAYPLLPDDATLRLRAVLLLEEALEQVTAMGFDIKLIDAERGVASENLQLSKVRPADYVAIVDGCADVSVINTGTMIALGLPDEAVLEAVDNNNLAKFGEGHWFRKDGKLMKPEGHPKPDLPAIIEAHIDGLTRAGMRVPLDSCEPAQCPS